MKKFFMAIALCLMCAVSFANNGLEGVIIGDTITVDSHGSIKCGKVTYITDKEVHIDMNDYVYGFNITDIDAIFNWRTKKAKQLKSYGGAYNFSKNCNKKDDAQKLQTVSYKDLIKLEQRVDDLSDAVYQRNGISIGGRISIMAAPIMVVGLICTGIGYAPTNNYSTNALKAKSGCAIAGPIMVGCSGSMLLISIPFF